jgi:N-acetylglutamate synthase/N-acetylornithine aminotransferase
VAMIVDDDESHVDEGFVVAIVCDNNESFNVRDAPISEIEKAAGQKSDQLTPSLLQDSTGLATSMENRVTNQSDSSIAVEGNAHYQNVFRYWECPACSANQSESQC